MNNQTSARSTLPGEPDEVPVGKLALIGLGLLAISALGVWWAGFLTVQPTGSLAEPGIDRERSEIGKTEIGMVDQANYATIVSAQELRRRDREKLEHWEWVDRAHGVVRMPIENAYEIVETQESAPAPASAPKGGAR